MSRNSLRSNEWCGSSGGQSDGFITRRSAVRVRPAPPMEVIPGPILLCRTGLFRSVLQASPGGMTAQPPGAGHLPQGEVLRKGVHPPEQARADKQPV